MGWNKGYTIFEQTIVGAYDLGVLNKDLLSVLLEPYRDTDIDAGGSRDLTSRDGLSAEEIVIKIYGLKLPTKPNLPKDESEWTEEEDEKYFDYQDKLCERFGKVTKHFGW